MGISFLGGIIEENMAIFMANYWNLEVIGEKVIDNSVKILSPCQHEVVPPLDVGPSCPGSSGQDEEGGVTSGEGGAGHCQPLAGGQSQQGETTGPFGFYFLHILQFYI